jgi:plastocyanin
MDIAVIGKIASRARWASLSPLGKLTLAALLLTGLDYLALILGAGASSDAVSLFAPHIAIAVVLVLIVAAGFRWAPGLAAVVMVGLFIEPLVFARRDLTNPGDLKSFAGIVSLLAILTVGVPAAVGATVQNYRLPLADRRAPDWLRTGLVGVAALALGAILTVTIQPSQTVAGVSPEVLATLPTIMAHDFAFDPPELQAKVGETVALRLENTDSTTHYFDIDALDVHVTMGPGKSSLAVFRPTQPGTYLIYCGAHSDKHAGTGMVGKLIVTE